MKGVYPRMSPDETKSRIADLKKMQGLSLSRKLAITIKLLNKCRDQKSCILFSGGKDSMIIADISRKIGLDVTLLMVETRLEFPGVLDAGKLIAKKIGLDLVVCSSPNHPFNMWKHKGYYPLFPKRGFNRYKKIFPELKCSPVQCCYQIKETASNVWMKQNNIKIAIWGLRADESNRRKFVFVDSGFMFQPKKYKWMQCYPILHWTRSDILKYISKEMTWHNPNRTLESGCRLCGTDILHKDSNLSEYLRKDREGFIRDMRESGMAEQISLITGNSVNLLESNPELFCRIKLVTHGA